jgi:hypothetical protein
MPFVDDGGDPQLNDEGQPIEFANCGAIRRVFVEGDSEIWRRFAKLATATGHLLESPLPFIQDYFPPETLKLADSPLRWLCAIFDLAWARIPESPLRPNIDKSVRIKIDSNVRSFGRLPSQTSSYKRILLVNVSRFANEYQQNGVIRGVGNPPEWFSTLDDVVQASVDAIEILLAEIGPTTRRRVQLVRHPQSLCR